MVFSTEDKMFTKNLSWAEFKPSVVDEAIDQWQPRLRACFRALWTID